MNSSGEVTSLHGSDAKIETATDVLPDASHEIGTFYERKTYWQKLSLKDKPRQNRLFRMFIQPLYFLGWPVIFYAGFAYGSSLIWFNVLNATASVILAKPPYNFRSSFVGLAYISCVIGVGIA
jgi:hypothetical protein